MDEESETWIGGKDDVRCALGCCSQCQPLFTSLYAVMNPVICVYLSPPTRMGAVHGRDFMGYLVFRA